MMHELNQAYTFWYLHRPPIQPYDVKEGEGGETQAPAAAALSTIYGGLVHEIADFHTVEEFWCIYGHLQKVTELPVVSEYHVFKKGIKPVWEDEGNLAGGKWLLRLKKGVVARLFEELLIALISGELNAAGDIPSMDDGMIHDDICGIVVSSRSNEDVLSVWNKKADHHVSITQLKNAIVKLLNLPQDVRLEYKTHTKSLSKAEKRHAHSAKYPPATSWKESRPSLTLDSATLTSSSWTYDTRKKGSLSKAHPHYPRWRTSE
jgi:translation initiation factor 4E